MNEVKHKLSPVKLKELLGDIKDLKGINHLFVDLKKQLIEALYDEELKDHLGFDKSENLSGGRDNYRNGHSSKHVKSQDGLIELSVPRDREGDFSPQIVPKHKRDIRR